jgi:hypothetical protein
VPGDPGLGAVVRVLGADAADLLADDVDDRPVRGVARALREAERVVQVDRPRADPVERARRDLRRGERDGRLSAAAAAALREGRTRGSRGDERRRDPCDAIGPWSCDDERASSCAPFTRRG